MGLTKSYTRSENHGSFTTEVIMKRVVLTKVKEGLLETIDLINSGEVDDIEIIRLSLKIMLRDIETCLEDEK